jgi:hypothetical protein
MPVNSSGWWAGGVAILTISPLTPAMPRYVSQAQMQRY